MDISVQLLLGLWGTILSTALALIQIRKYFREKPHLVVDASLLHKTCDEEKENTHGVKVHVKRGDDLCWEEVLVCFEIRNFGLQAVQVNAIYVETAEVIHQITPNGLSVILQPNTSTTIEVQPEYFVPSSLTADGATEGHDNLLQPIDVLSFGVLDALGKKHRVRQPMFDKVIAGCKALPLRIGVFRHKETGNMVTAFQVVDLGILINK
jgi:hypothetical protein